MGKVTLGQVFIRALPFLLVTIIPPVLHTSLRLHNTLTKISVNLHENNCKFTRTMGGSLTSFRCISLQLCDMSKYDTQALGEIQKFSVQSEKFAMQHLTLEGFIRSRADVMTEFYEQLKRRQLAASRIVRSQSIARAPSV